MTLRRGFWLVLTFVVLAVLTMLATGCSNILDMAEGLILRDEVVAEAAESSTEVSARSAYLAGMKADTTASAVAAAQGVIEARWGLRLEASDLAPLSDVMDTLQDVLEARALDSEAEALRRLEEVLRALEPLGQ